MDLWWFYLLCPLIGAAVGGLMLVTVVPLYCWWISR